MSVVCSKCVAVCLEVVGYYRRVIDGKLRHVVIANLRVICIKGGKTLTEGLNVCIINVYISNDGILIPLGCRGTKGKGDKSVAIRDVFGNDYEAMRNYVIQNYRIPNPSDEILLTVYLYCMNRQDGNLLKLGTSLQQLGM